MKIIKKGSTGSSVKLCQDRLNLKGFGYLVPDGVFGTNTDTAVRQFQAAHNLVVDGVVGDKTWTALMSNGEAQAPEEILEEEREELRDLYKSQLHLLPPYIRPVVTLALEAAIRDLGCKESPDGSNYGTEIEHLVGGYNQYWWVLNDDASLDAVQQRGYVLPEETAGPMAWCGMATSNWIREGYELPYWDLTGFAKPLIGHPLEKFHGGPTPVEEWAEDRGRLEKARARYKALPGTLFTMSRGSSGSDPTSDTQAGHIGMVIGNDKRHVITIEGNVSNKIKSNRRKKSSLRYFVKWW